MFRRLVPAAIVVSVALSAGPLLPQVADGDDTGQMPAAAGPPAAADRRGPTWLDPEGGALPFADVDEVLEFLAEAEVLDSWPVGTGITEPRKLLLERHGVRAHAIFHDVDIQRRRAKLRGHRVVYFFRDHYAHNVAAFELSRLLGMANVPPAVIRRVDRREGSVQLWIENANTEVERRRQGVVPPEWRLAINDMHVFDNLANNIDRNQGNMLYDARWRLWYIDHTRAFNINRALPSPERVTRCSRRLWKALRELDESALRRALLPYLKGPEVDAILIRHERLLELIGERIARQGEDAVLFSYGAGVGPATAEPPA